MPLTRQAAPQYSKGEHHCQKDPRPLRSQGHQPAAVGFCETHNQHSLAGARPCYDEYRVDSRSRGSCSQQDAFSRSFLSSLDERRLLWETTTVHWAFAEAALGGQLTPWPSKYVAVAAARFDIHTAPAAAGTRTVTSSRIHRWDVEEDSLPQRPGCTVGAVRDST